MNNSSSYILNKLKTPRLTFRKVNLEDADQWMEFFNSFEALRFLPFKQNSRKACLEWLERQELRYEETNSGLCALIERSSGEMVGQCGLLLQEMKDRDEIEIGYHLIPRFWKKGYATEAAGAAKNFAFEKDLSESLISIIHVENVNSQKVAERNGMKKERKMEWRGFPVFIYRITKEEWVENNICSG